MRRQPDVRDTKDRNCIVIFSPCCCCVGQDCAPYSVEIGGGIIQCLWGNKFTETSCILFYSAVEIYDSRVKLYTPCSSFIDWVESDVTRALNHANSVLKNCIFFWFHFCANSTVKIVLRQVREMKMELGALPQCSV